MDKEAKVTAVSRVYSTEDVVPKSVFEEVLDRYERSLVHLGQVKEQNRHILEMKSQDEDLQKKLQEQDAILAKKQQSIAELEMYIKVLEEENKKKTALETPPNRENKAEQKQEVKGFFQFLNTNELEALDEVFTGEKNK